jgi:outer membrane biosynthesis protein TonB
LALKRAKPPRSELGTGEDSVTLLSGSLRNPDETDALTVELTISHVDVAMHTEGTELGSWPLSAVTIKSIDATSFEFVAEGDVLILTPDDPALLATHPLVTGVMPAAENRKDRKRKKKTAKAELKKQPKTAPSRKEKRESKPTSQSKPPKEKPSKPSRRERKAASTAHTKKSDGVWLRTLDNARRHDVLGLNRVQVNEELRGHEHEHTWDNRVASTSGAGSHICTICGKFRVRTK